MSRGYKKEQNESSRLRLSVSLYGLIFKLINLYLDMCLWEMEISDSTMLLSSPVFPLKVGRVSTVVNLEFTESGFTVYSPYSLGNFSVSASQKLRAKESALLLSSADNTVCV